MSKIDFRARIDHFGDRIFDFWFDKNSWRFYAVMALITAAPWLDVARMRFGHGDMRGMIVNLLIALGFWLTCFLTNVKSSSCEGAVGFIVISVLVCILWPVMAKVRETHFHSPRHHAAAPASLRVFT